MLGRRPSITGRSWDPACTRFSISWTAASQLGAFDCYMACVATNRPCPEGMEERTVEAATYAVFECVGPMPEAMTNLWHRILTEWLPSSGYRWESKTDVERYFTPRMTAPDSRSEVWLPVVKA